MTKLYLSMPQPGETITEGTIVEWIAKPGSLLKEGDPVAQLETEKAVFEYECPFDGTFIEVLHQGGSRVKVAAPIAIMDVADDKAQTYIMMGIGKEVEGLKVESRKSDSEKREAAQTAAKQFCETKPLERSTPHEASSTKLSPLIRKLAAQHNLSDDILNSLAAKNPEGRVTKEAIENYISGGAQVSTSSAQAAISQGIPASTGNTQNDFTAVPCSAIRMRIADNMVLSKSKIPHAHNGIAVDITHVVEYREKNKDAYKSKNGTNLNFLTLIYPALIAAIKKTPVVNASYDDTKQPHQIKLFNKINLGVAVGSENGLVIPVVHDVASLSAKEFNVTLNDKLDRAQKQKLMPNDLMGATLIFNNFGFFGTQIGVQIIQYPMAATLGMSVIEKRAVVIGNEIKIRTMSDFILSFDHRVMDGRETGIFLSELKRGIENLKFETI